MDATMLLTKDHQEVERLFKRFEAAGNRALVNITAMRDLVGEIIERLTIHAEIEEEIFYPAVRSQVSKARGAVVKAVEAHQAAEALMEEIKGLAAGDGALGAKVTVLIDNVRQHRDAEEQQMFPRVRAAVPAGQLEALGQRLERVGQYKRRQAAGQTPQNGFFPGDLAATVASLLAPAGRLPGVGMLGRLGVNICARLRRHQPGGPGAASPG